MPVRETLEPYLLRVLCALLTERSVSRAALKLDQSQPAVSLALKKLREITGDPILVRSKAGMVPTERGLAMLERARAALVEIGRIIETTSLFDPGKTTREFRIGTPDYLATFFIPHVLERLRAHAPHAKLAVVALGPHISYELGLEHGDLDVVVANWAAPPENYRMQTLFEDDVVALVSRKHRHATRPWSIDEYLQAPHLAPPPFAAGQRNVIDAYLTRQHLHRNVVMTLPYFSIAPYVLANSDLVFTSSRHFCEHFARILPLAVVKPPIAFPLMRFYQLWHERTHHAAECAWLRKQIYDAARALPRGAG